VRYRIERFGRTRFSAPVREHHFELRIAPWDDAGQRLTALELTVVPPAVAGVHRDCFGNQVHRGSLMSAHAEVAVRMVAEVETLLINPFDYQPVTPTRELEWVAGSLREAPRLLDFLLCRSAKVPDLTPLAREGMTPPSYVPSQPVLAQLKEAMVWVQETFEFDPEGVVARPRLADLFEEGVGNSRDLAHLFAALGRSWGLPARYVRGYLDPAYFEPDDEDEVPRQLPQISHAWAEVLVPGAGWRGFDAARGLLADQTYIRVAVGRDSDDVPTQRNTFKGEAQADETEDKLDVQVLGASG
jgi:transglutaminase-like putative cysteine protease